MTTQTIIVPEFEPEAIAREVANIWTRYNQARSSWLEEKRVLREYLFATDTSKTSNKKLPWKNSTVTPKLTQIRDNLHANYMAALFPSENWFSWESESEDAATQRKKRAIEAYMRTKLKQTRFQLLVSQLLLDYIDDGNVFAGHEYVELRRTDQLGLEQVDYRGPRAFRISPLDLVMNPLATSFTDSPVVIRRLLTAGDVEKRMSELVGHGYDEAQLRKALALRHNIKDYVDQLKSHGLEVDGFGTMEEYLQSGTVELLELLGDVYDSDTQTLHTAKRVTVVDRRWVVRIQDQKTASAQRPIVHCGWRLRPDNLWAQGPLDQLIGMQYRIDHLENLKADVFDLIAHPVVKVRGSTVEDFDWGPGEVVHCGDDGDINMVQPDATALNADMQIRELMDRMEEMAGAPRQAMGIRTPGEKTKYEVQVLENGAGRIFQSKVAWFEMNVIEPLLNSMLAAAVESMGSVERVKVVDPDLGVEEFIEVTKDDLKASGRLYPMGARHFAEKARFVQELTQTLSAVQGLPGVAAHFSGKAAARALEETMGWSKWGIVKDNIAVIEQLETQRLAQAAQEQAQVEADIPSELQPEDFVPATQGATA